MESRPSRGVKMKVGNEKVVTISYVLKDAKGQLIEDSLELGNLDYLHGKQNIVKGLEEYLEDRECGFEGHVIVQPEKGYGPFDQDLIDTLPLDHFDFSDEVEPGMEIVLDLDGQELLAVVEDITEDEITLNANHPLAGIALHFDVQVKAIRKATQEELDQGYPTVADHH